MLLFALSVALAIPPFSLSISNDCESDAVAEYADSLRNASQAVLIEIDVIANAIISGFNSTNTGNSTDLYQALTAALQVNATGDNFATFEEALDQITTSYFESCYGTIDERPSPSEVETLVYDLVTKLNALSADTAETQLPEIRRIFGRLACLIDTYGRDYLRNASTNDTVEISVSPTSSLVTPTATPMPTVTPETPVNCTNLGGTYINIDVFYQCVHSDDLKPIFGIGPVVTIEDETVILKRCIGFVVDTTGSMSSEISYVRQLILDFLDSESIVPACYALVDFNDYGYATPELNVGTAKIYDPLIQYSSDGSALTLSTGGTVYGAQDLRSDVNALYASGGGDCPEYGMTGILKLIAAINTVEGIILPSEGNLHHVIVLTDASAKDDSRYQQVINAANSARSTVHFFYSGSYCGSLGNYETVRTSTGGIRVDSISDFGAFATFINTYNSAAASRRRRTTLFTACAPSHSLNTTHFTTSLNILISTCNSQYTVYVTKPDGTTQSLSVSGTLVLYSVSNPPAGTWTAYATYGNIKVSVSQSSEFDLDISYTKVMDGRIVPTGDIPQACTEGTIIATTPQLNLLSSNHSISLDILNSSGHVVAQSDLTRCSNFLSGSLIFPSSSLVFYRLRGSDISNNPFSLTLSGYDGLTFQPPLLSFHLIGSNIVSIAPGKTTKIESILQYSQPQGEDLQVTIQAVSSLSSQVTVNLTQIPNVLRPNIDESVLFEITASSGLAAGTPSITANITVIDSCKYHMTNFTIPLFVCNPIDVTVINQTLVGSTRSLHVTWTQPSLSFGIIELYRMSVNFGNGTETSYDFGNSTLSFSLLNLSPYQLVYMNVIAYDESGNNVGCSTELSYRSEESVPTQVSFLNHSYPTNNSFRIYWGEPTSSNGVLLHYSIIISENGGSVVGNFTVGPYDERSLIFNTTDYSVYEVTVRAATSRGFGSQNMLVIYPNGGLIVTDFEGTALSSTSIYLSWSSPPIAVSYHFIMTIDEIETERTWSFFSVENHATILSLHPYYHYSCRIGIVTDVTYPFSVEVIVQTLQSAPTAAPVSLSHSFVSSNELNLTWSPPPFDQQNGFIQYYTIYIYENETGLSNSTTSIANWILLDDLHPFYSYEFMIKAVTIAPGPFSTIYRVTMPEDAPLSPPINVTVSLVNSTSITIHWLPPPFEHRNGIVREYLINVTEVDSGNTFSVVASTLSTVVSSLHPNYNYRITVRAVTVAFGPPSTMLLVQTLEDVPSGSPEAFNATITSPYSAILTWDPPPIDQQNGVITGYIINVTVLETGENFLLYSNTTSLIVDGLRPFRTFECIIAAQTNIGLGPYSATFTVSTPQDAPSGPPLQLQTTFVSAYGFSLSWNPPAYDDQNGIISYYVIRVLEVETGSVSQHTSYSTVLSLSSLHPAYTYYCSIAAYTVALGPFSIQFNVTTNEAAPSEPPQSFNGYAVSSSAVSLSWNPPPIESRNGLIISYHLNITSLETGISVYYMSSGTTIVINGLAPYTTYSCIVAAETSIGRGPYTTIITFTTHEDAPVASPSITSSFIIDSRSVAIQWTPPPVEDHNGIIRKYIVSIRETGTNITTTHNTTGTTAIIGSLTPSYTYQFSVAAYTVAVGPFTSLVTFTLPEDSPSGYPQDVSVNYTSPYSVSLTWMPPPAGEQNGAIIGYVINVTHADTLVTLQYRTIVTAITINGLDPYTTYVCVVAAETSVGIGPFSHLFFVQTDEAAPDSPPQHPNAIALSPTSIHITWDPPLLQDHNGVIREYRVNVTEAVSAIYAEHITNQTQLIVTGLKPFHIYFCSIVAVTVDEGPYTVSVSVLTEEDAPSSAPQSLSVAVTSSTSISVSWIAPPSVNHNGIIREYDVLVHQILSGMDQSFTTTSNMLNISVLSPYTMYSVKVAAVTVETGPFTASQNITTLEDEPSSPPESFNASVSDSTSVLLQWAPPIAEGINGIIQHYNITVTEIESGTVTHYTTSSISLSLTNLHPFYTYKCSVAAVTIGIGPVVNLIIQMPEDAPSSAPTNIVNTAVASMYLTLSWNALPFEDENGLIRHYLVNVTETNTGSTFLMTSSTLDITLNNLHPYYTYSISVAAYTVSAGPFSDPVSFTTAQDVPSGSPISIGTTAENSFGVTLQWLPPLISERNGIIIGYNVTIEDHILGTVLTVRSLTTSITLSSLDPYTTYQCTIAAYTTIGLGPFSAPLIFRTLEAAPSQPPEMIRLISITSSTITVTWQYPPLEGHNGIIRGFVVSVLDSGNNQLLYNVTGSTFTISDLQPYSSYNISVAAFTMDTGPFTNLLSVLTSEAAPSAPPSGLSLAAVDSSTLSLSWNPPGSQDVNGVIRHYVINVSVMDTLEHFQYTSQNTSLLITELHPYYTYTVYIAAVTVSIGPFSVGYSIRTPPAAPSGTPQNVTGLAVNSTAIQVFWDPPHSHLQNGIVSSYIITVLETRTNFTWSFQQSTFHSSYIITGLHPYYEYRLSIAAYTVGLGPSSFIHVTTSQDTPTGSPLNLTVNITSSTTALLYWAPPVFEQRNGIIQYYEFTLYSSDSGQSTMQTFQSTSHLLTGLHPFYTYSCNITAVTIGPGPPANIVFQMSEDVPTAPPTNISVALVTSTSAVVSWNPPPVQYHNGIITGYTITLTKNDSSEPVNFVTSTTSIVLSPLEPFSQYRFRVSATTSQGPGPMSNFTSFQTQQAAPSVAPSNLVATSVTSTSFTLQWQQPSIEGLNGHITGFYVLTIELETGHNFINFTSSPSIVLDSLHPHYTYNCSVATVTVSTGPFSEVLSIQTDQAAPSGPPLSVTVNISNSQAAIVSWNTPLADQINGIIQYYAVRLYETETSVNLNFETNATSLIIRDLHPYYTYTITVAAVTIAAGPYSSNQTFTTPQDIPSGLPQNVSVTSINSTSFLVQWSHIQPNMRNGLITAYNVIVIDAESNSTIGIWTTTTLNAIIGDLHPYNRYKILVAGSTIIGTGPYALFEHQTDPAAPTAPPQNLNVTFLNTSTVTIEWSPPVATQQNGPISHYILTLHNLITGDISVYNITTEYLHISNLHPFYSYECRVTTVTVGPGPDALASFAMPEDVPISPPNNLMVTTLNYSALLISWSPPAASYQNGVIRYYAVHVHRNYSGLTDIYTVTNSTEITVTNLKPFTYCLVKVAAFTVGTGPFTIPVTIQLPEAAPASSPGQFVAEQAARHTLHVSWFSPPLADINGALLGYQLNCTSQDDHTISSVISGTTAILYNVHNNTHYTCQVCAYTSVGCGPVAITHISTYENSLVGPPHSLSVMNVTATAVHLSWQPPFNPDAVVLSYTLTYQMISTTFSTLRTPRPSVTITSINETTYLLQSLLVSSTYEMVVFVNTEEGTGPASEPMIVTTSPPMYTAPQNLKCATTSSSSIFCTWMTPSVNSHDVQSYALSYRLIDGFDYYPGYGTTLGQVMLQSSTLEYSINDLLPYAGYMIEVEAYLLPAIGSGSGYSGEGEPQLGLTPDDHLRVSTTTLNITHPETPSAMVENVVINVISPTSMSLSWKPPKKKDWKGRIESYSITAVGQPDTNGNGDINKRAEPVSMVVSVSPRSNDPDPSLAEEPLQLETYLLEGLEENFEYTVTITVINAAGNGIASSPSLQIMPQAAPSGPPTNITLANVSLTSINVTWLPPNPVQANGIITGYKVIFSRIEINEITRYTLPAHQNYFVKNGLHAYEEILIQVAAQTVIGIGPYSSQVVFYTSADVPDPVQSLKVTFFNDTSVLLEWESPSIIKGVLLDYQIIYSGHISSGDIDGPYYRSVGVSDTPQLLITALIAGYFYQFTVRVRNSAGYSLNVTQVIVIPDINTPGTTDPGTGRTDTNQGLDQANILTIAVPVGSALAAVTVCAVLAICIIVYTKKSKKTKKKSFSSGQVFTINPLTNLPVDEEGSVVPLRSVRQFSSEVIENTYEGVEFHHQEMTDECETFQGNNVDCQSEL